MSKMLLESTEVKYPVPWGHIAAKVYGPQKERKILMVHGILDNAGTFDRLLKYLPQEYQYVCIDLPGHGLSSAFPSGTPLHFFDYVHSILLVLNALKWKTCTYIAHSFGVHIGIYFSILYPERVEKLIGLDGFLPFLIKDTVCYIRGIYNLDSYSKDFGALHTKENAMYALRYKRQEALTTEAAEAIFTRSVTKVDNLYKYNRDPRLRTIVRPFFTVDQHKEAIKRFSTPCLLLVADSSSRVNKMVQILKMLEDVVDQRNFSFIFVRGNHDVHNNYPERVAPHICNFLNKELQSKL